MRVKELLSEASNTSPENALAKMVGGYHHGLTYDKDTCYAFVGRGLAKLKPDDATIRFWGIRARNGRPAQIVHGDAVLPNGNIITNIPSHDYEKYGYQLVDTMPLAEFLKHV